MTTTKSNLVTLPASDANDAIRCMNYCMYLGVGNAKMKLKIKTVFVNFLSDIHANSSDNCFYLKKRVGISVHIPSLLVVQYANFAHSIFLKPLVLFTATIIQYFGKIPYCLLFFYFQMFATQIANKIKIWFRSYF